MLLFDLGRVEIQLELRALRCVSGLIRTGKSDDDADLDWILPIAARATSAELESSVHLLWPAQEMSETIPGHGPNIGPKPGPPIGPNTGPSPAPMGGATVGAL